MKSRIAGSVAHARRSAAFVSSTGTFDARNDRMSVPTVIDWSGGKLAGSKAGEAGETVAGVATAAAFESPGIASIGLGSEEEPSDSTCPADSCFIRDQRDMMFSYRLICCSLRPRFGGPASAAQLGPVAL